MAADDFRLVKPGAGCVAESRSASRTHWRRSLSHSFLVRHRGYRGPLRFIVARPPGCTLANLGPPHDSVLSAYGACRGAGVDHVDVVVDSTCTGGIVPLSIGIVGAGPCGSRLARHCESLGFDVRLYDRAPDEDVGGGITLNAQWLEACGVEHASNLPGLSVWLNGRVVFEFPEWNLPAVARASLLRSLRSVLAQQPVQMSFGSTRIRAEVARRDFVVLRPETTLTFEEHWPPKWASGRSCAGTTGSPGLKPTAAERALMRFSEALSMAALRSGHTSLRTGRWASLSLSASAPKGYIKRCPVKHLRT